MEWMDPTKLTKQMEWTDPAKLTKQVFDFQKATFNNSFDAMALLQDQAEKAVNTLLAQAAWLPKEGREAIDNWIKSYKKGREDYKKMIIHGLDNMETFFAQPKKEEATKEAEKEPTERPEIKAAEPAKAPAKEPPKQAAKSK